MPPSLNTDIPITCLIRLVTIYCNSYYGRIFVGKMNHPAFLENVRTPPFGVLHRLNNTHQRNVAAHCRTKKKRENVFVFHFLELIRLKSPAGSNFDRDVICHFRDTIIGLKEKRK